MRPSASSLQFECTKVCEKCQIAHMCLHVCIAAYVEEHFTDCWREVVRHSEICSDLSKVVVNEAGIGLIFLDFFFFFRMLI